MIVTSSMVRNKIPVGREEGGEELHADVLFRTQIKRGRASEDAEFLIK